MKTRRLRSAGMSLTELLIVLSLLAVVAAFCIPAFQSVFGKQRGAICTSQLHQLGLAIIAYTADNDGKYPPSVGGYYPEAGWGGVWYHPSIPSNPNGLGLAAYTGGTDALFRLSVCPLNLSKSIVPPCVNPYGYPYMVNYHVMPSLPYPIRRNVSIPLPSKTIMMMDCATGTSWALGTPTTTEGGGWQRVREAHYGKANMLWADGHVSAHRKSEIIHSNVNFTVIQP